MKTADFFNTHSVFSLNEAARILAPAGGRSDTVERLKYHLKAGRLKLVVRGVYAVVPQGVPVKGFQPDPFWVATAVRPDGIFSYHSSLELLGVSHSAWTRYTLLQCTVFCALFHLYALIHPSHLTNKFS